MDVRADHPPLNGQYAVAFESIRSFVDKLSSGEPFIVSIEDAACTSLAILAIIESARTRMPIEVDYGSLDISGLKEYLAKMYDISTIPAQIQPKPLRAGVV